MEENSVKLYYYSKENLDDALKQLGKEFRRLNGTKIPAEIILVGGAAIVAKYGFRSSTTDIDAIIQASSSMKEAINRVGDANGYSNGWLNQDFKNTDSYSPKIVQYSIPYRTFSNILHVRTLPPEYIAAMKLASLREYKYDKSDIIGIVLETGIRQDQIVSAINDLYGSIKNLRNCDQAAGFLDQIYSNKDLKELYENIREEEQDGYRYIKEIDDKYEGLLNQTNANDIIRMARQKKVEKMAQENTPFEDYEKNKVDHAISLFSYKGEGKEKVWKEARKEIDDVIIRLREHGYTDPAIKIFLLQRDVGHVMKEQFVNKIIQETRTRQQDRGK